MLFHLGVVKALRDYAAASATADPRHQAMASDGKPPSTRIALESGVSPPLPEASDGSFYVPALIDVKDLYAVSGGSILAAHMIVNWNRYTGSDPDFARVEREILGFSQRNLRDRILRRWVLFRWLGILIGLISRTPLIGAAIPRRPDLFSRTFWLQQEYDHFLGKCTISDTAKVKSAPSYHILTTSFTTGALCSFSGDDFIIEGSDLCNTTTACGHLRLSLPVAASSAFPPMFPPIELNDDMLANPDPPDRFERLFLSDGGVFDNLGVEKFLKNKARLEQSNAASPSTLVVSDAGGSFRAGAQRTFGGIFSRNVRASDILMHRLGDQAKSVVDKMVGYVPIRISTTCEDEALGRSVQRRLRLVRTDFDKFDPKLGRLLIEHGERVTHAAMTNQNRHRRRTPAISGPQMKVEAANGVARKAADRSFWSLIFTLTDWTIIPLAASALIIASAAGYYIVTSQEAQRAEERLEREKDLAEERYKRGLLDRALKQEQRFEKAAAAYDRKDMVELGRFLNRGLSSASQDVQADEKSVQLAVAAVAKPNPEPTPLPTNPATASSSVHPQPVFIQFAGLLTREEITNLNSTLKNQGWDAQSSSGERTPNAAGLSQVRFAGPNEQAARQLAAAINDTGLITREVQAVRVPVVGPKNLEVWISR